MHAKRNVLTLLAATGAAVGIAAFGATSAYAAGPLDWTQTETPDPGNFYSFDDLEVLSASDVWGVGSGPDIPMLAHWDGKAWTERKAPADVLSISDIDAADADDIWGVGSGGDAWYEGRVFHYDGEAWTSVKVPLPEVGEYGQTTMNDVAADGEEVWATGMANRDIDGERVNSGFVLHFDGDAWSLTELEIPKEAGDVDFTGLDVLADGTVVTTGVKFVPLPENPAFSSAEPWVNRFDGAQWTDVGYVDFGTESGHGYIGASAADKDGEGVWAVGTVWQENAETGESVPEPYLVHYDAESGEWTRVKLPPVVGIGNGALAVDKRGGVVIGVAELAGGEGGDFLLHHDGSTVERWEEPQHKGSWTYGAAAFVPGTNILWLGGCTREESGRPITGIASYARVPLKH